MKPITTLFLLTLTLAHHSGMAAPGKPSGATDQPAALVKEKVPASAQTFDLNQVQLLDGPFKHARELQREFLLKTELDFLLYPLRREAKLPNPGKGSDALGWATTGHMMGHYLSACALMIRNTGDEVLKKNADAAVVELAKCQEAIGNGYLGGFPERSILHLERLVNDPSVSAAVPWYCLHKIYAGLLDMYVLTGNKQALEVLEKAADWIIANTAQLDEGKMQEMLNTEHGGMNEVLANLYAVTGKDKHLKLAQRFNHRKVIDPFVQDQDPLDHLHANTTIPKFIGVARQYQLTGEAPLLKAANGFWNVVVDERSYVTGGNSAHELFSPKAKLSQYVHHNTTESCNEYNMLKLTRRLFQIGPKAELADYYERTQFNHILSTQNPATGGQLYFQQLQSGSVKAPQGNPWSLPNDTLSCCQGTGLESHSKHADSIYFHDGAGSLWVNQFIASELKWKDKGVILRQETQYPDQAASRLLFTCAKPVALNLQIRRPWWATHQFEVLVNGKKQEIASQAGSYVSVRRTWKTGDAVEIVMPMSLRTEGFKDNPKRVAVMFGPLVLAGVTELGNRFSAIVTDDAAGFLNQFKPVDGKSLEFTAPASLFRTSLDSVASSPVAFKPLFRIVDEPKTVYWDLFTSKEFEQLPSVWQGEVDRHKALEPKTVDLVLSCVNSKEFTRSGKGTLQGILLGKGLLPRTLEQVAEDAHNLQFTKGEASAGNKIRTAPEDMFLNIFRYPGDLTCWTRAIPGKAEFSYEMKVVPGVPQRFQARLWHPELGESGKPHKGVGPFEVLVNGKVIGTCQVDSLPVDEFVDVVYPIPAELTKEKERVTVTLRGQRPVPGLYECRILK